MADVSNLKLMLGIETADTSQDNLLQLLKTNAQNFIRLYLRSVEFASDLDFISDEMTIKRYNKISSEGYTNESISSRNVTFQMSDIEEYKMYLDNWLSMNTLEGQGNRLRML